MQAFSVSTIVLLLGFIQIHGQTENSNCGRRVQPSAPSAPSLVSRMLFTYETEEHWPWHAAIYHNKTLNSTYQCGGTVITPKSILTAAHCVSFADMTLDTNVVSVYLGRLSLDEDGQFFEVAEIIVHPDFNSSDLSNDIAIIVLSTEATFNDYVQPICLSNSNQTDLSHIIGKFGTVVGWGLTEEDQISIALRQASLPVVSWGKCLKSNPDVFGLFLSETNFCAGHRNGTGVCQGDSGGGMTFEENGIYYIRGIVSVSPSKMDPITQTIVCDTAQYALYTDVAKYLSWIKTKAVAMTACETVVKCSFLDSLMQHCAIVVQDKCKVIIDEELKTPVTKLYVNGEFDMVPDISEAMEFENLEELIIRDVKLKIVERLKLVAFKNRLHVLDLCSNEISHLDPNTFDDLKSLRKLFLSENHLKELPEVIFKKLTNLNDLHLDDNMFEEVPANLFKELSNLRNISLKGNQLTTLPKHLFRNNEKLKYVMVANNNINRIEFHFADLSRLQFLDLTGNDCINEKCSKPLECRSFRVIFDKIQINCTDESDE